ncbi:acetyltransferase [Saccharospirillum alexandrii]|uniref:acetyltransferase n=1 Tax=Saccharospirillum alexandrii TaxID=2448477 RepID=UPI003735E0D2
MKQLAILGASGHGRVIADAAELSGWQKPIFFDDAWPSVEVNGPWSIEGDTKVLIERLSVFDAVAVAIGNNRIRALKLAKLSEAGGNIVTIVHPSAVVSRYASIEVGSVILANAVVNASAKLGSGVIVNTGAVIEHDCVVGDYAHISPNAMLAGGVRVGELAWIGASAAVRQLIEVGEGAIVGMGSVVTRDVPTGVTVAGVPAKTVSAKAVKVL